MAPSTESAWLISPLLLVHSPSSAQASLRCMLAAPLAVGLHEPIAELTELLLQPVDVGPRVCALGQPVLGHPNLAPKLVDPAVELVERPFELLDHRESPSSFIRKSLLMPTLSRGVRRV